MHFMQSYFDFLLSGNQFTDFPYFQIFSWPYSSWIIERKSKSENVKIQFESLRNKSVAISKNLSYFSLRYEVKLKILELQWTFRSRLILCYSENVRESSQTFLVPDIALNLCVRKLCTKTMQTKWRL